MSVPPANSTASALAEIEELLAKYESGTTDVSKLPVVEHSSTGLRFRVGPMDRAGHEAWHNLRYLEERQYQQSGAEENGAPFIRKRSDEYLLTHAVWSEEGKLLPDRLAKALMSGSGPAVFAVLEAAAAQNPPREAMVDEIQKLWAA